MDGRLDWEEYQEGVFIGWEDEVRELSQAMDGSIVVEV